MVELKDWLGNKGAEVGDMPGPNKGGTVEVDGRQVHARERLPLQRSSTTAPTSARRPGS